MTKKRDFSSFSRYFDIVVTLCFARVADALLALDISKMQRYLARAV